MTALPLDHPDIFFSQKIQVMAWVLKFEEIKAIAGLNSMIYQCRFLFTILESIMANDLSTIEPFEVCSIRPPTEDYSLTFRLTRNRT